MVDQLKAILISGDQENFRVLEGMLNDLSVQTWNANGCVSAATLVARYQPNLIFVDVALWDDGYEELVDLARQAELALNLIVVGTVTDIDIYISSIQRGAFSFVAPPFSHDSLGIIVRAAAIDVRQRREDMAQFEMVGAGSHSY
jgi:DNA-binding NtrC family response regulator